LYEIVDAFEDQCLEVVPEILKELRYELEPYIDFCKKVKNSELPQESKDFWMLVCKSVYAPQKEMKLFHKYKKLMKILENGRVHSEINDTDIENAKHVPIEDLYDFQKVKRTAKGFMACCPFGHTDKTPSFSVKNNRFNCFSCGTYGDSIDFIMKMNCLTFPKAVAYLVRLQK
jgi:hypothetical protein